MANVNCTNCTNCTDCVNCVDCINCTDCMNCTGCWDCADCTGCTGLTDYEGVYINPVKEANNQRFTEVIAVLSTVAPGVSVTNVGCRWSDGSMWVHVPRVN